MAALTPIDAKSVVKEISRPADTAKDVASWFKQEVLELNFGDVTGRPDENVTLQREYLAKFLETGWVIDAVLETGSGGNWVSTGGNKTVTKSQQFYPDFQDSTRAGSAFSGLENDLYYQTSGIGWVSGGGSSSSSSYTSSKTTSGNSVSRTTSSTGASSNNGTTPVTVTQNISTPSAEAPAHWMAYQKIRLKRRRIVAEEVMKSMLTSFTAAYNGGRELEDKRYNQVVSLYALMLQRSESEGNAIISGAMDLNPLLNDIKSRLFKSMDETEASGSVSTKRITDDAIADIEREFAAKIAAEKAREISIGLYTTTVWPTVEAAYLRQKEAAMVKARATSIQAEFSIKSGSSNTLAAVAAQLANAAATISKQSDDRNLTVVNMRNSVLKWMLDYVGGRKESYPELEESATLTEQLGFSNASVATSVL